MSHDDGRDDATTIAGTSVEDAVAEIAARDDAPERDEVRRTLDLVAADGVVSRDAASGALADASKAVMTAETRVELAAGELANAEEEAASAPDLDVVADRLDDLDARLSAVEARAADLADRLDAVVERSDGPGALYEVAAGVRQVTADANDVQRTADELAADVETFQRWLADPSARLRELDEDADAVAAYLDELAAMADEVAAAASSDADDVRGGAGEDSARDAGVTWAEARLLGRVIELLLADLRAELADLRAWADYGDDDGADEIEAHLDNLDARLAAVGDRLDDAARPEWIDRFGDRVTAFERAADEFEPPVDWGEVQATFEQHRSELPGAE